MPPFEPGWRGGPGRPPGPSILNRESAQALLRSAKKIGDLIARERGDGAGGLESYWDELYRVDPVRHHTLTAQNHPRETAMAVGVQVEDMTPRLAFPLDITSEAMQAEIFKRGLPGKLIVEAGLKQIEYERKMRSPKLIEG